MHDVVVLSDLHLGRGKNPDTGRYFSLEAFFYDDDLRRLLRYLCDDAARRDVDFKLIFNGDVFDLLRIEPEAAGPAATAKERRFGKAVTPPIASHMIGEILAGHPGFVDGVAQVLEAGHDVVFLPGNHDIELQWEPVHSELRRALLTRVRERAAKATRDRTGDGDDAGAAGEAAAAAADARLEFAPWFYYEPGRIWVEHGCQYDAESAFRFPLRGAIAAPAAVVAAAVGDDDEVEVDLPLGSFIQRYLYNAFGPITFMVPSTRANFRYFKWLLVNRPRLLARVLGSHGPFALQLLRRLSRVGGPRRDRARHDHEIELAQLAAQSRLHEKLVAIDALKQVKHDVVQAVRALGFQMLKFLAMSFAVAIAVAGLWFAGFHTINTMRVGFGPKALLFLGLNFVLLSAALVGSGYGLFRAQPGLSTGPLTRAATEIARLIDVPIVTFGHTHDEAIWRLWPGNRRDAWYFNTGTWIAVFTHDELMPRERVQFTFLRVSGHAGELLHWSPGRGEPVPVILLDEETPWGPVHADAAAP